jgi:hypothetical protein
MKKSLRDVYRSDAILALTFFTKKLPVVSIPFERGIKPDVYRVPSVAL